MRTLLSDGRLRAATLNGTLIVLFLCAWASDKWPTAALAVIAVAAGVVAAEVALLVVMARAGAVSKSEAPAVEQATNSLTTQAVQEARDNSLRALAEARAAMEAHAARMSLLEAEAVKAALGATYRHHLLSLRIHNRHLPRYQYNHASDVMSWYLSPNQNRMIGETMVRRKMVTAPTALERWKLHAFGSEVFDIDAGAFVLEHAHGKTMIRILDPTEVSVENSPELAPIEPIYAAEAAPSAVARRRA